MSRIIVLVIHHHHITFNVSFADLVNLAMARFNFAALVQSERLYLNCKGITDSDVMHLCEALRKPYAAVTEIYLTHNSITDEGAIALAEVIGQSKRVTYLFLNHNSIGDEGAMAIAKHCIGVEQLGLMNCGIYAEGVIAIMKGLGDSLVKLSLMRNPIGDSGVQAIADALVHCHRLTDLYLHNVGMTSVGAKALLSQLRHNEVLERLEITNYSSHPQPNTRDALVYQCDVSRLIRFNQQLRKFSSERFASTALAQGAASLKGRGEFGQSFLYLAVCKHVDLVISHRDEE